MEQSNKIPLPLVIVGLVIAVGLAIFMGVKAFGPPAPAPMSAEAQDKAKTLEEIVIRTGGDMGKATPEDQKKLQEIAGEKAGLAYFGTVTRLKSEGKLK